MKKNVVRVEEIGHIALLDVVDLAPEDRELLASCTKAKCEVVEPPAGMYALLRSITANGRRFADKVTSCGCSSIDLYVYADNGYTLCEAHGLQDIGHLRAPLPNLPARLFPHGGV